MNIPNAHNPIALITGGSRGLGRNTALQLARRGVDVVLTWQRNQAEAEAVVDLIRQQDRRAVALQLDVANASGFRAFSDVLCDVLQNQWGRDRFNFLVNNAGAGGHVAYADTSEQQFDELMNIHLKGPFFLTQTLLPLIADGGRIINISSGLARFTLPGYAAYATMKGGVEVMTRYMAKELGARGIAVNTVAPGAIETDFGGGAVRDNKELNDFIASQTALGRVGRPDDIGSVIASLLSADNAWINAQRIEASGGQMF